MRVRENYSDHLDRLLDKVAAAAAFRSRIPDSIEECLRIVADARREQPAFRELGAIVGPRQRSDDVVLRKNAWILQHAVGARSFCVGNCIVFRRRIRQRGRVGYQHVSPVLDQLNLSGIAANPGSLERLHDRIEQLGAIKKLDALCIDAPGNTIYLMQGLSYSQARRLRPSVTAGRARAGVTLPLFGQFDDRPLSGAAIHAHMAFSLRLLADFVQHVVPGFRVVPVAMICADPEAGWQFQAHDLSEFSIDANRHRLVDLDQFPMIASSLKGAIIPADEMERLPSGLATRDVLRAAPVDRATRAFMTLTVLWDAQWNAPGALVSMPVGRIAEEVGRRFGVVYSRDLRRHDMEDCLEKLGYIETPLYRPGEYGITHRGVGRLCLLLASTSGAVPVGGGSSLEENVVHHVMQQSMRWDEYCFGPIRVG